MSVLHAKDDKFDAILSENKLVAADFFATWCGPCKMFGPIFEEAADAYEGRAALVKVDVDEAPALSARYGVQSVPSLLIFKDGKLVETAVGMQPKAALEALLNKHLG